jgi:hypothetical protein
MMTAASSSCDSTPWHARKTIVTTTPTMEALDPLRKHADDRDLDTQSAQANATPS